MMLIVMLLLKLKGVVSYEDDGRVNVGRWKSGS